MIEPTAVLHPLASYLRRARPLIPQKLGYSYGGQDTDPDLLFIRAVHEADAFKSAELLRRALERAEAEEPGEHTAARKELDGELLILLRTLYEAAGAAR